MKKFACLVISMVVLLSSYCLAEETFVFRNIPWGTDMNTAIQSQSDFEWNEYKTEHIPEKTGTSVMAQNADYTFWSITGYGDKEEQPQFAHTQLATKVETSSKELKVAGYTPTDVTMYFAFIPEDGKYVPTSEHTALYAAEYSFVDVGNAMEEMKDDLVSKLSSLYGEPSPDERVLVGTEWRNYVIWNGTESKILLTYYPKTFMGKTKNNIYIIYFWDGWLNLFNNLDEALNASDIEDTQSTDGL